MPTPSSSNNSGEPSTDTSNPLRRAMIEIADLRIENQMLHERIKTLARRLRELDPEEQPEVDLRDS
jgi:hypothetical protein